jgi:hypothetical protein
MTLVPGAELTEPISWMNTGPADRADAGQEANLRQRTPSGLALNLMVPAADAIWR